MPPACPSAYDDAQAPPVPLPRPRLRGITHLALAQEGLEARAQRGELAGLLDGGQQVVGLVAIEQELVAAHTQHAGELHERLGALLVELAPEDLQRLGG